MRGRSTVASLGGKREPQVRLRSRRRATTAPAAQTFGTLSGTKNAASEAQSEAEEQRDVARLDATEDDIVHGLDKHGAIRARPASNPIPTGTMTDVAELRLGSSVCASNPTPASTNGIAPESRARHFAVGASLRSQVLRADPESSH
jgi:hypothetical protein